MSSTSRNEKSDTELIKELKKTNEILLAGIETREQQLTEKDRTIKELRGLEKENEILKLKISNEEGYKQKIHELSTKQENDSKEIIRLKKRVNELIDKINETENERNSIIKNNNNTLEQLKRLTDENKELNKRIQNIQQNKSDIPSNVYNNLNKEYEKSKQTIVNIQNILKTKDEEIKKLNDEYEKIREYNTILLKSNKVNEDHINSLGETINILLEEIKTLNKNKEIQQHTSIDCNNQSNNLYIKLNIPIHTSTNGISAKIISQN
ncbi:hypothetical protein, conserved [Entamoeba dispar SAW760]|uniref:Uncharacterized protein n=1 Tax=Entamoeba dispar (strain ATCC PRA-260 / SAW760) TaxID=370354 RepID=B0EQU1_ENTDS|nr:uncharacterized protein EDI_235960 [Entamoeba dispar SAW760]EDR23102.1 hypothetical protein, conserved [Entamoeba dispar SAW760]|eukprot:EDR23102.1 hypothetical protein, conserved [Entamoeba dispar SAW760]